MGRERDDALRSRLDLLEHRGSRYLEYRHRRAALAGTLDLVVPAALGGSGIVLLWSRVSGPSPVAIVAAWLAIVAIACAGFYAIRRRSGPVERRTALAVFDRRLGLKDRIAMADEFVRADVRDGFREAALAEAGPSIDRSLADPLAIPRAGSHRAALRRWPLGIAAIGIVIVAILFRGDGAGGIRPGDAATSGVARDDRVAGVSPVWTALARRLGIGTGRDGRDDDVGAAERAVADATGGAGQAPASGGATGRERPASSSPDGRSSAGDARARADAAIAAAGGGGNGEGGGRATEGGDAMPGAEAGGQQARIDADAAAGGDRGDPARAAGGGAPREGGGAQAVPRPAQPSATTPSAGADGQQQGSQANQGQPGSNGASQSGPGNGQGGGGQRSNNDEASKRARGVPRLLLAVPMRDRLIGTPNPGPVTSVTRDGRPQAFASGRVAAGARGAGSGDAGRIAHRPVTAQERRLLRDVFRRGAVDGAAR